MKNSIFANAELMTAKTLKTEKAANKRAVREALREYLPALDGAFKRVAQSADKRSRDVANAAKGKFAAAAAEEILALVSAGTLDARTARMYPVAYLVAKCYPWQTEDGILLHKRTEEREDGERVKVWRAKKLTKAAADVIMSASLCAFVDACGKPQPEIHAEGERVE